MDNSSPVVEAAGRVICLLLGQDGTRNGPNGPELADQAKVSEFSQQYMVQLTCIHLHPGKYRTDPCYTEFYTVYVHLRGIQELHCLRQCTHEEWQKADVHEFEGGKQVTAWHSTL